MTHPHIAREPCGIVERTDLNGRRPVFEDRGEAGRVLAGMLEPEAGPSAIILAIPAGGVPVADPLADALDLPLDVCVVSKITLPWNSEAGYGAVAFDGSVKLNDDLVAHLGLRPETVAEGVERTREKVSRRVLRFRGERPALSLAGRTAVLVDDGLASGFTMRAAAEAVRGTADRVVVAVPTGHRRALEALAWTADRIYCANIRSGIRFAVAEAYRHWHDVSEETVMEILDRRAGSGE
jgi:putative phosphoribosyl transferase